MRDQYWGSEEEEKKQEPISIHEALKERQNASSDDFNTVNVIDNKIYFYSGVSRPKVLKLNQSIVSLNRNFAKSQVMGYSTPPIKVHINSYGGSVFAGLAAVDYIKSSKANVETIIDGCAASAATMMSVVANHRSMHRNSCMLIHQLSGMMWGKFAEMKDDMQNSEMLMNKIKNIYREHTKIPEDVLEDILKHDIWWEAEKCLEYGLVDEII
jgi:ATP-dependent Clp protease protease subunit